MLKPLSINRPPMSLDFNPWSLLENAYMNLKMNHVIAQYASG
jgi:hypothetical protein